MAGPRNLVELIRQFRPTSALFSTYTFSVSHFDAALLPVLRSVGCQDMAVMVDATQAASSVDESSSKGAGRVYRIIPVIAPGGGVFHPKFAYLSSDSGDVLAVSSANLTASGQCLQLECFDTVAARDYPSVFEELSDWMASLALAMEELSPQAAALARGVSRRARAATEFATDAPAAVALPPPSLVHTIGTTPSAALQRIFEARKSQALTIRVLSPFHAPDAGPVLRLARELGAATVCVGVDGAGSVRRAPFDAELFNPNVPVSYMVADAEGAGRRLHAKVFEVETEDAVLSMTGSINATRQSFESQKNVELSLARWSYESPFSWREIEPDTFARTQDASAFEKKAALFVDAWLSSGGTLHGKLVSKAPLSSKILLRLSSQGLLEHGCECELNENNTFEVDGFDDLDTSQSVCVEVECAGQKAQCWLNVEAELELSAVERDRYAAVARVLKGQCAPEDIAEVLRMLLEATSTLAVAPVARGEARAAPEFKNDGENDRAFSFALWKNSGAPRSGMTMLSAKGQQLLRELSQCLNGRSPATRSDALASGFLPEAMEVKLMWQIEEADADEEAKAIFDAYGLLDRLCQAIPELLGRNPNIEIGPLMAQIAAVRAINRASNEGLKMAPCLSWLDRFSRFTYPEQARDQLTALAAAMAGFTSRRLSADGHSAQLGLLKECVERFAGQKLELSRWQEAVREGLSQPPFSHLGTEELAEAAAMYVHIFSAETLDARILELLRHARQGTLGTASQAVELPHVAASLHARKPRTAELLQGVLDARGLAQAGCPICARALQKQHIAELVQQHVLVHSIIDCNRLVFYSEGAEQFRQAIEGLPNA